jgi:ATP-dependent DNA helicase RecG
VVSGHFVGKALKQATGSDGPSLFDAFDWLPPEPTRLELLTPDDLFDHIVDQSSLESFKEDKRLERKPAGFGGSSLAEYLSMWANTPPDGGLMIMGINDDGSIQGCRKLSPKKLNELEAMQDTCPDANCVTKRVPVALPDGTPDFVVVVRVFYRKGRAVRTPQGTVHARRGDRKKNLGPEEARELAIDKGEIDFEQEACTRLEYPRDFDRDAVRAFADNVREVLDLETDVSDETILSVRHLGVLKGSKLIPNIACALLFAKEPDRLIPGCKVRFLRFDGDQEGSGEKFNAVKDIWVEGFTVPTCPSKASRLHASRSACR